ncbi:MAG: hypothetical protein KBH06_04605 [Spirochaetes bacterium]|nr:hypothetical protein [Spirochaetota bacterium]
MQVQTILMTSDERAILAKSIRDKKRILLIIRAASLTGPAVLFVINRFMPLENFYYYFPAILISEVAVMLIISRIIKKSIILAESDFEKGIKEIIAGIVSDIDKKYGTIKIEDRKVEIPVSCINSVKLGDEITAHVAKESGFTLKMEK